jgi:hypothetical protein
MLNFLDDWTIDISKLPKYDDFTKPFTVPIDKKICELLVSGVNPKITDIMITNFKRHIIENIDDNNRLVITHSNPHGLGRFYSKNDGSPVCHSKYLKHTVFQYQNWLDVDMEKGHCSILRYVAGKNNEDTSVFDEIVFKFDEVWVDIAKYYYDKCRVKLDDKNVKYFFNMTIYGGGYSTWIKKLADVDDSIKYGYPVKIIPSDIPMHPIMKRFKNRCVEIMKVVYVNNPDIANLVCDVNDSYYEKMCSTISYFCGVIENDIVYFVYKFFVKYGGIIELECAPEMDGICMPRIDGIDYKMLVGNVNNILSPFGIRFKIKPYKAVDEDDFVLRDVIEMRRMMDEDNGVVDAVEVVEDPVEVVDDVIVKLNDKYFKEKDKIRGVIEHAKAKIDENVLQRDELQLKISNKEVDSKIYSKNIADLNKEIIKLEKEITKKENENDKLTKQYNKEGENYEKAKAKERATKMKEMAKKMKEDEKENKKRMMKDNKDKINEILYDLTDAGFSREFANLHFKTEDGAMPPIVFTGGENEMKGYKFNGVYWEQIMNTAELHKRLFDELYNHYEAELFKCYDYVNPKEYTLFQNGIKKINSYITRINILRVFQTSFYVKNIEWNRNRDLFVFEDMVYDLKSGGFIQGNPDDYVNMTCGYKYDFLFDNEQLIIARNGILKFVESITGGVDERDYMIKTYSRGLKQLNQCEKAYFIIGSGRNGKGTNSLLNSRALGDYFGTLNMEYYTVHKKSIDEPNQNLYNCRNSRVLSSSETNDEDANGRKVKFIISKFQSLTGNDLINARAIGTQDVAYFHAGVPIIDINFMIDFSKKEIDSIRERIDIQETPFTFTDDDKIINEYPDKYRKVDITLKEKFASDIYRRAMIDLLFEYYGKDVKRPLSVKKRTDAYFADDTLESWINENCIVEGDGEIELSIIQSRYRTDTDKIMTIRAIKEYLTNKKFVVKQKEGINQLRGYAFVKEDEDEEKK